MAQLGEVVDALAALDPDYLVPDERSQQHIRVVIDEAIARLTATKARELARIWSW